MAYENLTGLPSVTEVIGPYIDKEWFTEASAERGTAVHDAMKQYLLGLYALPLPAEWQGYFDSGRRWVDKMVERVVVVEERLIDLMSGFCGQLDLLAMLKNDAENSLVDWKTSIAVYDWYRVQIAGYRRLGFVNHFPTHRGMTVRLRADGKMPKADEYQSYNTDLNVFRCCLGAYKFFKPKAIISERQEMGL